MGVLATAQLPETPMINTHIFENQLYHDLILSPYPFFMVPPKDKEPGNKTHHNITL